MQSAYPRGCAHSKILSWSFGLIKGAINISPKKIVVASESLAPIVLIRGNVVKKIGLGSAEISETNL